MTATRDPWRVLGLRPGSSVDEIRRAYRALAKANHPDAAGEAALPRFLAIQAAYEQLGGGALGRRPGSRPDGSPGGTAAASREPWRADPDRARASGRADGRRPGARPAGPSSEGGFARGAGSAAGTAPRSRPRPGGASPDGAGSDARSSRDGAGSEARGSSDGTSSSGRGSSGTAGSSTGASASSGRARRPSSRRQPKTATPYSTSYDSADEEPFEPGWTGGTWYGASSGTYWTINPKEYADPRKHGPEYQARARRGRTDAAPDGASGTEPGAEAAPPEPDGAAPDRASTARAASEAAAGSAKTAGRTSGTEPDDADFAPRTGRGARARSTVPADAGGPGTTADARPGDGWFRPANAAPPPVGSGPAAGNIPAEERRFRGPVLPRATSPAGRFGMALLGWPPLALFVAAAIGESTGCGRYAASCSELSSPGTWIVSAAILLLLLALPAVATWSAHGTIATLVIGLPSAVVLSAAGGTNLPQASAPLMVAVLAVAYLAGVAYGLLVPRLSGSA